MNLVLMHGAPATGKYTVGRELAALTGYLLYHNHLVVDEVLQRHAFGSPEFVNLRDRLWRDYFTQAAASGCEDIIFTFSPENTVPQEFIDWLFGEYPAAGVRLLSVELTASEPVIERRLADKSRFDFKKLTGPELYRELRATGTFASPVIPRTDLRIDTEKVGPTDAARLIFQAIEL